MSYRDAAIGAYLAWRAFRRVWIACIFLGIFGLYLGIDWLVEGCLIVGAISWLISAVSGSSHVSNAERAATSNVRRGNLRDPRLRSKDYDRMSSLRHRR
jgi:hypothetical protein